VKAGCWVERAEIAGCGDTGMLCGWMSLSRASWAAGGSSW
jgi:hypothetical protein